MLFFFRSRLQQLRTITLLRAELEWQRGVIGNYSNTVCAMKLEREQLKRDKAALMRECERLRGREVAEKQRSQV